MKNRWLFLIIILLLFCYFKYSTPPKPIYKWKDPNITITKLYSYKQWTLIHYKNTKTNKNNLGWYYTVKF